MVDFLFRDVVVPVLRGAWTSCRGVGRVFFRPGGRPGAGRVGCGASAGQTTLGRMCRKSRRTRAGAGRCPFGAGTSGTMVEPDPAGLASESARRLGPARSPAGTSTGAGGTSLTPWRAFGVLRSRLSTQA